MKTIVYKNLNKRGPNGEPLWSIKQSVDGGKPVVVGHATEVGLINVTPKVTGSYDRIRAAKTREVFAWLEGDLGMVRGFIPFQGRSAVLGSDIDYGWDSVDDLSRVTFHPFAEEKRGFFWVFDGDDFDYAFRATFTATSEVYCYA